MTTYTHLWGPKKGHNNVPEDSLSSSQSIPCNNSKLLITYGNGFYFSHLHFKSIIEIRMGKHTKPFSLCSQPCKSACLYLIPACIHLNTKDSVHLLFIVYTEPLQGMFSFQYWARISLFPIWYVLQQTCLLKSCTMKSLSPFVKTYFTSSSQGFRRG